MKKFYFTLVAFFAAIGMMAQGSQGWPANYGGVMLQGFSWDSFSASRWTKLEKQADDLKGYIDLVWVPQSGKCLESGNVMGYTPYYYFNQNSSFGTEAELRSMIKTFKANGIGTIADVVVNHHNTDGWFGFPAEEYKGVTYQFQSTDICANDDNGKTAAEANRQGISLSSNNDEGEDWDGCRDLDHKSENVQKIIKAYVKFLKDDLGYTGFRYDMVKGFHASHVGDYNDAANIDFSVGECWNSNQDIENWINYTQRKSAAFDFQFRYNIRDAVNNAEGIGWSNLNSTNNLIHDPNYRRYAVTFVENHDMQDRGTTDGYTPDAITKYIPACNAYMLAMPGTPCIFQPHWLTYKDELKLMIEARKLAGITNMSNYTNLTSQTGVYANEVTGEKGKLIVVVGLPTRFTPSNAADYVKIISKTNYHYYLSKSLNTVWLNKPSCTAEKAFNVIPTIVSDNSNAKLVYTLDGSDPTVSSPQATSGKSITIAASCTLKMGLLIDGVVKNIVTREYKIEPFNAYDINVYVNTDKVNSTTEDWSNGINFWVWDTDGKNLTTKQAWPGDVINETQEINGKKWYHQTYNIKKKDYAISFVFSIGSGDNVIQTKDIPDVDQDIFIEIQNTKDGKSYEYKDVTSTTGIADAPIVDNTAKSKDNAWYSLSGARFSQKPIAAGIYVHQGKKMVIK